MELVDIGPVKSSSQNFLNPESYFCFYSEKSVSCYIIKKAYKYHQSPEVEAQRDPTTSGVGIFDTTIAVQNDRVYAAVRGGAENRVQQLCAT